MRVLLSLKLGYSWIVLCFCVSHIFKVKADSIPKNLVRIGTYQGKAFFVDGAITMPWLDARSFCEGSGMNLSSIESVNEQMFLEEHFDVQNFNGNYWTSGRNALSTNQFVWDLGDSPGIALDEDLAFIDYGVISTCVYYVASSDKVYNGNLSVSTCTDNMYPMCSLDLGADEF